jgi:hypothetical protein
VIFNPPSRVEYDAGEAIFTDKLDALAPSP